MASSSAFKPPPPVSIAYSPEPQLWQWFAELANRNVSFRELHCRHKLSQGNAGICFAKVCSLWMRFASAPDAPVLFEPRGIRCPRSPIDENLSKLKKILLLCHGAPLPRPLYRGVFSRVVGR